MAARIGAIGVVTPVDVSLWTTHTALIACAPSARNRFSISAGLAPWRQSPGMKSTTSDKRSASFFHRVANWPVSAISTRSPGDSVLTSAASHAPVPLAG
jgi:hypothetical protein